ncbi:hypothetical protein G8770_02485 [Aestuariicella hydrocarbonica]|uniref:Lipoprotein n=1 Tax=Pseudomaricurvus hydrocarbonicus TaxID=1470433 RepID=A0A9E5MLQ7_9GAMM|nr:hypothetical protein [Aestuariicella hydrocarbonica]NHO64415.1 hypothetical protein [Aestuariicella hydrocarbonica]
MMMKPYLLLPLTAVLVSGCGMNDSAKDQAVAQMSNCEKVLALIDAHPSKFVNLRTNLKSTRKISVWDARYQLVGKNCQVWGWGTGKSNYTCNLSSPNQEIAMEHFATAKELTQSCLGNSWQLSERPRKIGNGLKATFTRPDTDTTVAIQAVETNGAIKQEWTTYFFVGDANEDL